MLTPEDLEDEELYAALKHSGIDPDSEDFLAHYGVAGMKWGVRNDDRSAGDKIRSTSVAANSKRIGKFLLKTSPGYQAGLKQKKKNDAFNADLKSAYSKKESSGNIDSDDRSAKSKRLGVAGSVAFAGGLGALGVSYLAKNTSTRIGASAVSILLSGTSIALNSQANLSEKKDVIKKYNN